MNLKMTALLVVAALVVGVVAYVNPFKGEDEQKEKSPWFYQVTEDDIQSIGITHRGQNVEFVRTEQNWWAFVDPPDVPPWLHRWGGIVLLLSGPQTRRDLSAAAPTIGDPAEYGLDDPQTLVDITLKGGRLLQFRLGDKTTDGEQYYAQVVGFPQLFLIVASWGDVISKIAKEPPIPKWALKHEPEFLTGFNLILDPNTQDGRVLQFRQNDGQWTVRDLEVDEEGVPVDSERWQPILPLLSGPPNLTVDGPLVEGGDFTPWGIDEVARGMEFRFPGVTQHGTEFNDGYVLRFGDKTPDGNWYYGMPFDPSKSEGTQEYRQPVLLLEANWTDTLFALFDDIPYGEVSEEQAAAQAN